jgi:hypothetical protein
LDKIKNGSKAFPVKRFELVFLSRKISGKESEQLPDVM